MDFRFTDLSRLSLRTICKAPSSEPTGHLESPTVDSAKTTSTNQDSATWTNATDGLDARRSFLTERTITSLRTVFRSFRDCTVASLTRALHTARLRVYRRRFRRSCELIEVSRERRTPGGLGINGPGKDSFRIVSRYSHFVENYRSHKES